MEKERLKRKKTKGNDIVQVIAVHWSMIIRIQTSSSREAYCETNSALNISTETLCCKHSNACLFLYHQHPALRIASASSASYHSQIHWSMTTAAPSLLTTEDGAIPATEEYPLTTEAPSVPLNCIRKYLPTNSSEKAYLIYEGYSGIPENLTISIIVWVVSRSHSVW